MKPHTSMGLRMGGFPMGLAIGAGAVLLARARGTELGEQVRPLFKAALKGAFRLGELGREWAAHLMEAVDDVHAEVRAELMAEKASRSAEVVVSEAAVAGAMDVDDIPIISADEGIAAPAQDAPPSRERAGATSSPVRGDQAVKDFDVVADEDQPVAPREDRTHRAGKGARASARGKRHDMEAG